MQDKVSKKDRVTGPFRAYPIAGAIAILVVVNFALLLIDPTNGINPDSLPSARTWVWWATQDFRKQEPPANIAILGCSIVMHSVWFAEASHRKQPVELIVDHESRALSDAIERRAPGTHAKAFNFGLPGAMISDDCMIVRALFNAERAPKMVVLGVSPRDLFDNTFNTPAGTKHYQYLSRFAPSHESADLLVPRVWERPKFWLQQAIYLKDKAKPLQNIGSAALRDAGAPLLNRFQKSPLDAIPDDERSLALFKDELERGFWIAKPNAPYRYLESAWDAQRKVGKPNPSMFKIQTAWLELFMQACKDRNIDVVLVNTPASDVARGTMGEPTYQRHLALLRDVSTRWNCTFVDANIPGRYQPNDWTDWGHMTDRGGQKTLDAIAEAVAANAQLVADLKASHPRQVAGASPSPAGN